MISARYAIQLKLPFSVLQSNLISDILGVVGFQYLAPSTATLGNITTTLYGNSRAKIKACFADEVVRGCFTYDGWKRFGCKFNGITFHFVDRDFQPRSFVIGFEEYMQTGKAIDVKEQVGMCFIC